ncbi:TIGR02391 family protein [Acidovorax sp. RAC01]|uniref:TIGR02391 family protein n=1 Tax=Acidovorax sp. RAC01 TaxID=1842533 RepID=UPI0009F4A43F
MGCKAQNAAIAQLSRVFATQQTARGRRCTRRADSCRDSLTDKTAEKGERVALMNLLTGALGSYKNPASHRKVGIAAEEARDMLILASHLLKIVEQRAP